MNLYNEILVVDLEATCWAGKPPEGQTNEIIEIGICSILVHEGIVTTPHSFYVSPVTSTISAYCTQLTGITSEVIAANEMSLLNACHRIMEQFLSKRRPWVSWGNYDRNQMTKQCARDRVPYPFGPTHINFKDLYALKHRLSKGVGLGTALSQSALIFEGQPHSGRDDAYNIARLFCKEILC